MDSDGVEYSDHSDYTEYSDNELADMEILTDSDHSMDIDNDYVDCENFLYLYNFYLFFT